ncbi:hypothetical protein VP01_680g7 [Puccinia sorghi]|uniref:Reverse transcriptase Ty1/copia-type domain-containing protein n=1 Tax=Puccinia sorghi TaxID=27349 RepID=A0A0L6UEK9_9BASI|nr:hypothetical protein VP01_680g7 [Puccinia sorghi]
MVWYNHWEKPENPLNTTWTFKIKDNCHNDPLKFKASLCVQGFNQIEGTDRGETFVPTKKLSTLRMILLYTLHKNLDILQFNVQGAFLPASLAEEVYIQTPKGFPRKSPYLRLFKSLCNNNESMIFFHVDDLILVGPGNKFKENFEKQFSNSSCHSPNTILGIKYEITEDTILLSNPKHINHGLEELGLLDARPVSIPLTTNKQLKEADDEEFEAFKRLNINYRSAVGLLNYISMHTRPDISFAISSLARFSTKPSIQHWHEVKKVWLYLKYTKDLKLTLKIRNPNKLLKIYSDSTWADDPKTRTSQSSYLCYLYGSLILWNSCRQRNITYSSTKAELNPLVDSFHEGIWLKSLLSNIWRTEVNAATHFIDNQDLNKRLHLPEK